MKPALRAYTRVRGHDGFALGQEIDRHSKAVSHIHNHMILPWVGNNHIPWSGKDNVKLDIFLS